MPLPLRTERLLLRAPEERDLAPLRAIYASEEAMRWVTRRALSDEEILERLRARAAIQDSFGFTFWTMERHEPGFPPGEVIGVCGLVPIERKGPEIEVGYHLRPDVWGRGYATEAARESLRFGFEEAGLDRVIAVHHPSNPASGKVMRRIGMRRLGRREHYGMEQETYEIEAGDWTGQQSGASGPIIDPHRPDPG